VTESQVPPPAGWRAFLRPLSLLALVVFGIYVVRRIPTTMELILVATVISFGINPLIQALQKKAPRLVVITIVYTAFLLLVIVGIIVVIPAAIAQMRTLIANSGEYLTAAQAFVERLQVWINQRVGGHMLPAQVHDVQNTAISHLSDLLKTALGGVGPVVVSMTSAVGIGISAIILSYYFLTNSKDITATYLGLFPERAKERAQYFADEVGRIFGGFVGGQVILSAFCGVITFLGLEFVLPAYALLLGILTGLLYAVPYLGLTAAVLIGFLLGLSQSWATAIWVAIIIIVVCKLSDTFLVPKVMSKNVGVSPMAIMVAVFAFGELFGVWGVVLAIPGAALVKCVWVVWVYPWLTGKPAAIHSTAAPATSVPGRS